MSAPTDHIDTLPQETQDRIVILAVAFHRKTGAPLDDIQVFMAELLKLFVDYIDTHIEGEP